MLNVGSFECFLQYKCIEFAMVSKVLGSNLIMIMSTHGEQFVFLFMTPNKNIYFQ